MTEHRTKGGGQIRVLIVMSSRQEADSLSSRLAAVPVVEVVGTYTDLDTALATCERSVPDIALVGHEIVQEDDRHGRRPSLGSALGIRSIVLVPPALEADPDVVLTSIRAGADGQVTLEHRMDALVSAMSTVLAGEKSFPTAALVRLLAEQATYQRNVRLSAEDATTWLVSPRRREVLQALAEGLTAREVAERLSISPHTVRTHISDILLQFGARSKLQAVLIAIQVGLITLPTS